MPISPTKFIKRCAEWISKSDASLLPDRTRGIYALLRLRPRAKKKKYDVVYIGMAPSGSIRERLGSHKKSGTKTWTHFSIFEVWDNVSEEEVEELEGLFREIYRKDKRANRFNKQKKCKRLQAVRNDELISWKSQT